MKGKIVKKLENGIIVKTTENERGLISGKGLLKPIESYNVGDEITVEVFKRDGDKIKFNEVVVKKLNLDKAIKELLSNDNYHLPIKSKKRKSVNKTVILKEKY